MSDTIICATDIRPPPPTPVNARNTMSCSDVFATDAAKEPRKKMPMPAIKSTLRDQMSDKRPYNNWNDVDVRKYAPAIHALSELAFKSRLTIVRAAASVVWSINARRSTLAHAKNIFKSKDCEEILGDISYRNDSLLRDVICLFIEVGLYSFLR